MSQRRRLLFRSASGPAGACLLLITALAPAAAAQRKTPAIQHAGALLKADTGSTIKKQINPILTAPGSGSAAAQPAQSARVESRAQTSQYIATLVQQPLRQTTATNGAAIQAGKAAFRLPLLLSPTNNLAPAPSPGVPAPPTPVYEARFLVDSFGLPWNTRLQSFAGPLRLFIVDTLNPNAAQSPLPAAVTLNLSADGATLDSSTIQITKTNALSTVDIATAMDGDVVQVHVTPLGLSQPITVPVRIARKQLVIALDSAMPGLGFGRRDAKIDMPPGFAASDSVDVGLEAANGSVSPEHVWIGPGRSGHVTVQSIGLGKGSLTARSIGFTPATSDVDFRWPIGFFVASLAGILAGGIVVLAFRTKASDQLSAQRVFAGGFVTGLVAAIAGSLLGVKIIGFDAGTGSGLVAVFVLAVIGSWAGPRIFAVIAPGAGASESAKAT
jgi:hypothetical protein